MIAAPSLIPAGTPVNVTPQANPYWCGREVCGPQPTTAKIIKLNFAHQTVAPAPPPPVKPAPPPAPTPAKVIPMHFATGSGSGRAAAPPPASAPDLTPPPPEEAPMPTAAPITQPSSDCPTGLSWGGVAAAAGTSFVLGLIIGYSSGRGPKGKKRRR